MTSSIHRFRRAGAHALRTTATPAERKLWSRLKRLPLEGTHFRRQVAIGPYVADFACLTHNLIVEIDGPSHGDERQENRDRIRTAFLERRGFRVIRFWNEHVHSDPDSVIDTILVHLKRR
jgi:very-short-patch-repair endonuclease